MDEKFVSGESKYFEKRFSLENYDLAATLDSGQVFRWSFSEDNNSWEGPVGENWVTLTQSGGDVIARTAAPPGDWHWLEDYFQFNFNITQILDSFPCDDQILKMAYDYTPGLRLLNQDHWECLASFILSSNKQIVHIRQMISNLCNHYGVAIPGTSGSYQFPSPEVLAACEETELRELKLGYRAGFLRNSAKMVADGDIDLASIAGMETEMAREELMKLPGVGPKIADCVLLFGYGKYDAFPVDTWILKVLVQAYFRGRHKPLSQLQVFSRKHFGPYRGYAQQFLFHWVRTCPQSSDFLSPLITENPVKKTKK